MRKTFVNSCNFDDVECETVKAFVDRNEAYINSQREWKIYGSRPDTFPKNKVLEA